MNWPQGTNEASSLPVIAPMAQFGGKDGSVGSIALSPDGKAAWFTASTPVVDIERALEPFGPGLFFGYLGLVVLGLVVAAVRIERRPRIRGHRHCRKCNYDLDGHAAPTTCPECGCDCVKRRPRIGRSRLRRYWLPVTIALAAASLLVRIGEPGMAAGNIARALPAQFVAISGSQANKYPSLMKSGVITNGERLYRVDFGGSGARLLRTSEASYVDIGVSPDGTSLIMPEADRMGIGEYDSMTGRTLREFDGPICRPPQITMPLAIGFTPDQRGVYIQWTSNNKCGVSLWELDKHHLSGVFWRPNWDDGKGHNWPRSFRMVENAPGVKILELPEFSEAFTSKTYVPVLHVGSASLTFPAVREADPSPAGQPAVSAKQGIAFFLAGYGARIVAIDLKDGSEVGTLSPPTRGERFGDRLEYCESTELLGVEMAQRDILVRDTARKRWVARLTLPEGMYGPCPKFSADGSKLCARVQCSVKNASGKPTIVHYGVVWDLSQLRKEAGSASGG